MHLWYPSSKRNMEWTFLFFRVSLSANVGLHAALSIHSQGSPSLLPMTFLFAMDEIEAIDAKAPSSISHFLQKMYNIDTDF